MNIVLRLLFTALALLVAAYFVPGIEVSGLYIALITAVVLGLVNLIIRPVLFVLTLPITLITFGLFSFVINAALFLFVASFIDGFAVDGFLSALLGSLVVSVMSAIANKLID